jgi:hypothetical protein
MRKSFADTFGTTACPPASVAVCVADLIPLLQHAAATRRTWVQDFSEDVMHVPQDLYEVLVAYSQMVG